MPGFSAVVRFLTAIAVGIAVAIAPVADAFAQRGEVWCGALRRGRGWGVGLGHDFHAGVGHARNFRLAEIVRRNRPNLKILFMTGYAAEAAIRSEFLESGMEMLTKPFQLEGLIAKIREMLDAG